MKTQRTTAFPGKIWLRSCLAALLIGSSSLQGQVVLEDDFESYADDFEFKLSWTFQNGPTGFVPSTEVNKIPTGGTKAAKMARSDDRNKRAFGAEIPFGVPARFTIYSYNTNFVTNTRVREYLDLHNPSIVGRLETAIAEARG